MHFKKILCPVDFSEGSRVALRYAVRLANEADAELLVAHAWHMPAMMFAGDPTFSPEMFQALTDDAKKGLDNAVREATELGGRKVTGKLLNGVPWVALVDLLEVDRDVDLVVMGTHGRTGLTRVLLGSVAEKLVRHAPCSVLAVRPDSTAQPFTHVLCPVDFSDASQYAVDMAVELSRPWGAGITLLHVTEVPVAYSPEPLPVGLTIDLQKGASDQLEQWARRLREKIDVPVAVRARTGRPGKEVTDLLDEDRTFDLVSIGSHGRTGIRRALLGSVAERVVRHAHCPVFVARKRT